MLMLGSQGERNRNVRFPPIAVVSFSRQIGSMKGTLFALALLLASGCGRPSAVAQVERVELRLSGYFATDISVNSRGEGRFHLSYPYPKGRSGSFSISPQQFSQLVDSLTPFQRQAVPFSDKSAQEFAESSCPEGLPFTTDAGALWVHWIGPKLDGHYLADFGCDAERHAARNRQLLSIVESLPVPNNL